MAAFHLHVGLGAGRGALATGEAPARADADSRELLHLFLPAVRVRGLRAVAHGEHDDDDRSRNERRDHYYTPDGKTQTKRRPNIFIFNGDSLDNDEVILAVENTPTYKRSKQKLNEIRSQAVGNEPQNVQEKSEADTSHGIISFV